MTKHDSLLTAAETDAYRFECDGDLAQTKEAQRMKAAMARCERPTLSPDDLIKPCILAAGHAGWCDTGRR